MTLQRSDTSASLLAQAATILDGPGLAPPSYNEAQGHQQPLASPPTDAAPPPQYDGGTQLNYHPLPEKQRPPPPTAEEDPNLPPIPKTALYLLGRDDGQAREQTREEFSIAPDPAMFEFRLACLNCLENESICACPRANPKTRAEPWKLPRAKRSVGSSPFYAELGKVVGEKSAHLSSAVANTLWPAIYRGMIPVISDKCVVVLRSQALDRERDPKNILSQMRGPVETGPTQDCHCGCEKQICDNIVTRHGLSEESLENCTVVTYTSRGRHFNAVRMPNGKTCFDLRELGYFDMNTADEDDFLFYCSILPTFGVANASPPPKDPTQLSWDTILSSLLHETLTCKNMRTSRYQGIPSYSVCDGSRAVMRAENFGVGPGFVVMDMSATSSNSATIRSGPCLNYVKAINSPRKASKDGFMSDSPAVQPQLGSGKTSAREKSWSGISLDTKSSQLAVKKSTGLFSKKTKLGVPRRPLPGYICSHMCTTRDQGKVLVAHAAGFAPPSPESTETVVYNLGNDPLPWLVVSQYAGGHEQPFYYVSEKECAECTITQAPRGSIVATKLPATIFFSGMIL